MILDSQGRQLKRTIGFVGGFVAVRAQRGPLVELSSLVGFTVALEEDDEETDAAPGAQPRMRRA